MAAAAMQAYLEPAAGGQFRKRSARGTVTQFTCAEFVQAHFSAVLSVTVCKATGFEGADWWSDPDLCIEVSAGGSYATTATKKNTVDPVWDETLLLWPDAPELTVRVYDVDALKKEELGCAVVPLGDDWATAADREEAVEIRKEHGEGGAAGAVVGTVSLTLSPLALTAADLQQGIKQSAAQLTGSAPPSAPTPAPAPAASQALSSDVSAADVFAAVHQPPLQIASGASFAVRDSITASVALDPDLSLAGATETLPGARPAALIPELSLAPQATIHETEEAAEAADGGAQGSDAADGVEASHAPQATIAEAAETAEAMAGAGPEGEEVDVMQKLGEAWAALADVFPDAFLLEGTPVAFIDAPSCTQVWVHCNERLKQVVIAFRGTESMRDWRTDCAALFKAVATEPATGALRTLGDVGRKARRGLNLGPLNMFFRQMIHSGFYDAYRSVDAQVREVVALCTGGSPDWSVTTTGHSLGGALATVCAYDLAISRDFPHEVASYTYGSPRVGNGRFARAYGRAVPRTFRLLNTLDIVPQLPPLPLYMHVGNECRLFSAHGQLALPRRNALSVFGGDVVLRETREAVLRPLGPFDTSCAIVRRLSRFVRSIFSGKFVRNHLGDKYIDSLCQVMLAASADCGAASQSAVRDLRDALLAVQSARSTGALTAAEA